MLISSINWSELHSLSYLIILYDSSRYVSVRRGVVDCTQPPIQVFEIFASCAIICACFTIISSKSHLEMALKTYYDHCSHAHVCTPRVLTLTDSFLNIYMASLLNVISGGFSHDCSNFRSLFHDCRGLQAMLDPLVPLMSSACLSIGVQGTLVQPWSPYQTDTAIHIWSFHAL